MRYRIHYAKEARMRFLSQRDILKFFDRALRRTGLPLKMTEGFNPRIKLSSPAPMPAGVESLDEVIEVTLTEPVPPEELHTRLSSETVEGIEIKSVEALGGARFVHPTSFEYEVELPRSSRHSEEELRRALEEEEFVDTRYINRPRSVLNLRSSVKSFSLEGNRLKLELAATDRASARLREVLSQLLSIPEDKILSLRIRKIKTNYPVREIER